MKNIVSRAFHHSKIKK